MEEGRGEKEEKTPVRKEREGGIAAS